MLSVTSRSQIFSAIHHRDGSERFSERGLSMHEMGHEESNNPVDGSDTPTGPSSTATPLPEAPPDDGSDAVTEEPAAKRIKVEQPTEHSPPAVFQASVEVAKTNNSAEDSTCNSMSEPQNQEQSATEATAEQSMSKNPSKRPLPKPHSSSRLKIENASGSSVVTPSSGGSNSSSRASLVDHSAQHETHPKSAAQAPIKIANPAETAAVAAPPSSSTGDVPLKSTTMDHLRAKYLGELEYMLREFRKLERQLLGAKGAAQLEESAGSRERREKLHSFILHLEDTVRQIQIGCEMESEGPNVDVSTSGEACNDANKEAKREFAESSALADLSKEKEVEENVQKLEEHILANLLPVKVRLKKQLAAQQGASRNPAGMPATRRGMLQPSAARGEGTFAAAAEQRRKQAEAARLAAQQEEEDQAVRRVSDPTQFGKPLGGGGSSLTQKLHGATLGSKHRVQGAGVGSKVGEEEKVESKPPEQKILYGGMVPGSTQHKSGVAAASGVHELVIEDPNLLPKPGDDSNSNLPSADEPVSQTCTTVAPPTATACATVPAERPPEVVSPTPAPAESASVAVRDDKMAITDPSLPDDERRKLRKKRRKKKLRRLARRREKERQRQVALHQQAQAAQGATKTAQGGKKSAVGKGQGKKKGPRAVEYICSLCSEAYNSSCDYNPWWALAQHECPKCRKSQIPRIDITSPANAIEYHPALLAHSEDNGAGGGSGGAASVVHVAQPHVPPPSAVTGKTAEPLAKDLSLAMDSDSDSDLSELSDGSLSDLSLDSDDSSGDLQAMSAAEQAEHERFGYEYKGPVLADDHAARLLILMTHASTCPCKHKVTKHRDVCLSTKYMMLHVRDCPGTTSSFDVCPFPWCRKVKHLMYHLVSCTEPDECAICSPTSLSSSLKALTGLNLHRLKSHKERLAKSVKAAHVGKSNAIPVAPVAKPSAQRTSPTKASMPVKKEKPDVHVPVQSIVVPETVKTHPTQAPATSTAGAQTLVKREPEASSSHAAPGAQQSSHLPVPAQVACGHDQERVSTTALNTPFTQPTHTPVAQNLKQTVPPTSTPASSVGLVVKQEVRPTAPTPAQLDTMIEEPSDQAIVLTGGSADTPVAQNLGSQSTQASTVGREFPSNPVERQHPGPALDAGIESHNNELSNVNAESTHQPTASERSLPVKDDFESNPGTHSQTPGTLHVEPPKEVLQDDVADTLASVQPTPQVITENTTTNGAASVPQSDDVEPATKVVQTEVVTVQNNESEQKTHAVAVLEHKQELVDPENQNEVVSAEQRAIDPVYATGDSSIVPTAADQKVLMTNSAQVAESVDGSGTKAHGGETDVAETHAEVKVEELQPCTHMTSQSEEDKKSEPTEVTAAVIVKVEPSDPAPLAPSEEATPTAETNRELVRPIAPAPESTSLPGSEVPDTMIKKVGGIQGAAKVEKTVDAVKVA